MEIISDISAFTEVTIADLDEKYNTKDRVKQINKVILSLLR